MKPFDLEKALQGHPLITRNGREVENFAENDKDSGYKATFYPYKAMINGTWYFFTRKGKFYYKEEDLDLFLKDRDWKPEPKMGDKILVYHNQDGWVERICVKKGIADSVICVNRSVEGDFLIGNNFSCVQYEKWKWPEKEKESVIDKITPYMDSIQENWAKIKAYLEDIEGADKEK